MGQEGGGLAGHAGLVGSCDVLQQLVEQLIVIAGLDGRAALAIDRDLHAVGARDPHAPILRGAGQIAVKGGFGPGESPGPSQSGQQQSVQSQLPSQHIGLTSFPDHDIDDCQYGCQSIYCGQE
jgi:hypothetical protein